MASASESPLLQLAEEGLRDVTQTRYTLAAAAVIVFYDWILTLDSEMRLIWPARRSVVKTIFLVNRYCVPIIIGWANYAWSGRAVWFKHISCEVYLLVESSLVLLFFASLHYIISLRAWTLYGRNKVVGVLLWGGFILYLSSAFVLNIKALLAIPANLVPIINICFGTLPSYLWSIWLPSIVFETFVFILTLVKAIQYQRSDMSTPILSVLYRDGFLYFLFISLNSACNLLFWALTPPFKVLLLKYVSTAVTLAAGSHLILDLREVGYLADLTANSQRITDKTDQTNGYVYANSQLRRMSAPPSPGVLGMRRYSRLLEPDRVRLVPPADWERAYDERHIYPPSPQSYPPSPMSYNPPSPSAVRFAIAV